MSDHLCVVADITVTGYQDRDTKVKRITKGEVAKINCSETVVEALQKAKNGMMFV